MYCGRQAKTFRHSKAFNTFSIFTNDDRSPAYFFARFLTCQWASMMCTIKHARSMEEIAWSKRLESVHKDVECFFGVLKGRFRILKLPILCKEMEDIDNVLWTCWILHNMLHSFDDLGLYEADVSWAGPDGLLDAWLHDDPSVDNGKTGKVSSVPVETVEIEQCFSALRNKLMSHYDYKRRQDEIV